MALFSRTKKQPESADSEVKVAKKTVTEALTTDRNLASVIIRPKLTEKSVMQGERGVYTFNVRKDATKYLVKDAIKALYNVTPVKVNIVNKLPRTRIPGGRRKAVAVPGNKKAYVYLKAGDTINLV